MQECHVRGYEVASISLASPVFAKPLFWSFARITRFFSFVSLQGGLEMTGLYQKANKELLESKDWSHNKNY